MRVDVHGERRGAVAEPVLHGLDVGPVADEERRLGVPELVELQPLVARPLDAGDPMRVHVPDRAPLFSESVLHAELAEPPPEDVRVVVAPVDVADDGALLGLRDRDRVGVLALEPPLPGLELRPLDPLPFLEVRDDLAVEGDPALALLALRVPRDLVAGVLLGDVELALVEVDVLPGEAEHLASPHNRVQGEQHRAMLGAHGHPEDGGVEPLRLAHREAVPLLGLRPGDGYGGAGVLGDEPVVDRLVHDLRELLIDAVQPALGRALFAHPGVGAPQGEGVELLQAVRAEGRGYPLDLVCLPVPCERAPELVLTLLVEAHRVFPDGDVARPHRRGVHDLGAVLHQCLGRLRLGAVHGAAGRLPVLARHGVLAERDPDAPRVLPSRLLHRPYAGQ